MPDSFIKARNLPIATTNYGKTVVIKRKLILRTALVAMLGGLFTLSGCATKPTYQNNNNRTIQVDSRGVPNYYRVKRGDTVSQIANRYGLNYRKIGAINHLDSRYTIYVGQLLKLWEGGNSVSEYNNRPPQNTSYPNYPSPKPSPNVNVPPNTGYPNPVTTTGFGYPTTNQVAKNFDPDTNTKGMWFTGRLGDPVMASKDGQVLYAGNGLPEYGNLVMIRHDSTYITAYAHNDTILVKEGDRVKKGQRIATMGNSGQVNQVALEFQIRESGTPIDPRAVLSF